MRVSIACSSTWSMLGSRMVRLAIYASQHYWRASHLSFAFLTNVAMALFNVSSTVERWVSYSHISIPRVCSSTTRASQGSPSANEQTFRRCQSRCANIKISSEGSSLNDWNTSCVGIETYARRPDDQDLQRVHLNSVCDD